jgi:hypothetical protein
MTLRRRRWPSARLAVFGTTLVTAVAAAGVAGPAVPAAAAAPVRTAWWNTAPAGFFPVSTTSGQLAVSEGATGPMALAALAYAPGAVPTSGATLTLAVDGNSSFGPAQVQACPVRSASASWKAGGGQTGSPPAYDCSRSVTGQVASSGSSVTFSLGAGQAEPGGSFNLAVLPASGALPFQMVIDPPGASSLAARPAPPGAGAPAPAQAAQTAPAPSGSPGGAPGPSGAPGTPPDQGVPLTPTDSGSSLPALPAPTTPSPTASSSPQAAPAPAAPAAGSRGALAGNLPPPPGTGPAGHSSPTGKILGFAALLIVLVLYSEGFGVLGGRVRPLSSRFGRQPGAGADSVSA